MPKDDAAGTKRHQVAGRQRADQISDRLIHQQQALPLNNHGRHAVSARRISEPIASGLLRDTRRDRLWRPSNQFSLPLRPGAIKTQDAYG